ISPSEINDLMVVDQGSNKISMVRVGDDRLQTRSSAAAGSNAQAQADASTIGMDVVGSPTAVLAMPKKANGERDLIVLRSGQATPSSVVVTPSATITVDRVDDSHTSACTGAAN